MERLINHKTAPAVSSPQSAPRTNSQSGFLALFSERRLLLLGGDVFVVFLMVQVAFALWHRLDLTRSDTPWMWFFVLLGVWITLASLNDLYDVPSSSNASQSVTRVLIVSALSLMLYMLAFFFAPREALPRVFFISFLLLNLVAMTVWRYGYARWLGTWLMQYRVLIFGDGAMAQTIADVLRQSPQMNYDVLGYVSTSQPEPVLLERSVGEQAPASSQSKAAAGENKHFAQNNATAQAGLPTLGNHEDLGYLVNQLQVHELVVAVEGPLNYEMFQTLIECQAWGVKVSNMADLYEKLNYRIPVEHIDPAWALHVIQDRPVFDRVQLALKRLFDLMLAGVGLLGLLFLFPFIALAIRLTSPGPIFYRQTRCGQAGKPFKILKFRTMSADAERDGKARWATRGDQRITPIGRFMRKTRIDELPQLINVLRGEMSFVGPRPERPEFVAQLQREVPFYYTRLMVKPGITGWAQIHYDYGNTVEDALIKLQYDFYYLRYWSIQLDLYTIFQTFKVVFQFKGI